MIGLYRMHFPEGWAFMCYFAFLCGIFSLELFSAHLVLKMWILAV